MKYLKTFWWRREGSTAVEFGLVAVPFMVLLFGALQLFLLALGQQLLETAAEASGRLILTGQATTLSQAQFQQAVCKYIPAIINCSSVMIDAQVSSSFSNANTSNGGNSWSAQKISAEQPEISPVMQNCASPGLFYQVNTGGDVSAATNSLFQSAVKGARLTN